MQLRWIPFWVAGCLAPFACSSSEDEAELVCHPNQFRACTGDFGKGSQQCSEDGLAWSECSPRVLDSGFQPAEAGDADAGMPNADAESADVDAAVDGEPGDAQASDPDAADSNLDGAGSDAHD